MINLISIGKFDTASGRTVYSVSSPFEMNRKKPEIIGREIVLDGKHCVVTGVERALPLYPIRKGEIIGLTIEIRQ